MLLLEAVPEEVSHAVVEATNIPVIGCGAGAACAGQVVVMQDLAGMTNWQPAFVTPTASIGKDVANIAKTWMTNVNNSDLGNTPLRYEGRRVETI